MNIKTQKCLDQKQYSKIFSHDMALPKSAITLQDFQAQIDKIRRVMMQSCLGKISTEIIVEFNEDLIISVVTLVSGNEPDLCENGSDISDVNKLLLQRTESATDRHPR